MNIGIYGGTFNPPHRGHSRVMDAVISQLGLDRLILMPTGNPPHKELPTDSAEPMVRHAMIELVGETVEDARKRQKKSPCVVEANDLEIRRGGKSYTVETLDTLRIQYPDDQFFLIMGEDMLMTFFNWVSPEKIAKKAHICGFLRSDQPPSDALKAQSQRIITELGGQVTLISVPNGITVSSTEIRHDLSRNMFSEDLLPCTQGQILSSGLYGVQFPLEHLDRTLLRLLVWGGVKPKRIPHIKGVEWECARLARRWGADENLARRAGILHDYSKYWTKEQHIAFCEQYQVELDHLEWTTEKLLHAKSGAAFARFILKEDEAICNAIDCHTTGKADMTTLDKILYMADYIEPQRDFPEVAHMRKLAYEDLDKAMGYGLSIALEEMSARNKVTHQNTLRAFEQYGK